MGGSIRMLFGEVKRVFSFHYIMNLLQHSAIIISGFKNVQMCECFGLFLIKRLKVLIPHFIVICICC